MVFSFLGLMLVFLLSSSTWHLTESRCCTWSTSVPEVIICLILFTEAIPFFLISTASSRGYPRVVWTSNGTTSPCTLSSCIIAPSRKLALNLWRSWRLLMFRRLFSPWLSVLCSRRLSFYVKLLISILTRRRRRCEKRPGLKWFGLKCFTCLLDCPNTNSPYDANWNKSGTFFCLNLFYAIWNLILLLYIKLLIYLHFEMNLYWFQDPKSIV